MAEFAQTVHKFALPVHHGQDADAIFFSYAKVIGAKSRRSMYDARTVFGGYKIAQQYAERIAATVVQAVGIKGHQLFVATFFDFETGKFGKYFPGQHFGIS